MPAVNPFLEIGCKARNDQASAAGWMTVCEQLALATPEEREAFEGLWPGSTETFVAPGTRRWSGGVAAHLEKNGA